MNPRDKYLKVYGTRYRCVLRYISLHELEPLASFVLNVIRTGPGQRRKIDRLLR
jgi:hypothetical protein